MIKSLTHGLYELQPKNASTLIFIISKVQNFRIKVLCDVHTWKFHECSICNAEAINIDLTKNSFK